MSDIYDKENKEDLVTPEQADDLTSENRIAKDALWKVLSANLRNKRKIHNGNTWHFESCVYTQQGMAKQGLWLTGNYTRGSKVNKEALTITLFNRGDQKFDKRVVQLDAKYPLTDKTSKNWPHLHYGTNRYLIEFSKEVPPMPFKELVDLFSKKSNIEFNPTLDVPSKEEFKLK